MRLFVGIPLADAVMHELAAVVARLRVDESRVRPSAGGLRWTEHESWHITLQFLGNTTQDQFECLTARLFEVRSATVPVQLSELGFFDRAGILFANVAVTPELVGLQQRVVSATSQCGSIAETRPFHPHITLARAKGQGRWAELRELQSRVPSQPTFTRYTAREFLLYESHLGQGGSRYAVREQFPLNKP